MLNGQNEEVNFLFRLYIQTGMDAGGSAPLAIQTTHENTSLAV